MGFLIFKSRFIAVVLLALLSLCAAAQELIAVNRWVTLTSDSQKSTLAGNSFQGSDYFAWAPVPLQPGGKYTLFAEWDDGKAMLVIMQGHDPRAEAPSPPSGAAKSASINISGGSADKINFSVDPRSPGNLGYLVLPAGRPGRTVRIMIKDPGDPDSVTTAVVNGVITGGVFSTPIWVTGRMAGAATTAPQGFLPLNTWVPLPSPALSGRLAAYENEGEKYFAVVPVKLERGGRYTLFAEWDDGKAMLLFLRGHDPARKGLMAPSGTYSQVTINISGGKAWRINFVVDPESPGDTAWIVFPSATPNRALRIMLKSPGDSDAVTETPVKGSYVGSIYKTPLHLFAPAP